MGTTKKHFYLENTLKFSDQCKALGHPARISIIELLTKNDTLNCGDLMTNINLSQSTISRHCQVLHNCGLIGYEVVGSNCFYRLDNRALDQISDYLKEINTEVPSITGKVYYPLNHN